MSTKRKDNGNGDHPPPDSTTKEKTTFCIGDEVLLQRKDGNFYLGTVVKIDLSREHCQVKFGDNTETWSTFTRLTKLSTGLGIMCVKCKVSQTDSDNDIVICDKCSRGYHQKCHFPEIAEDYLKEDAKWECVRCSDTPGKRTLPLRKSTAAPPQPPPPPPVPVLPTQTVSQPKPLTPTKPSPQLKSISQAKPAQPKTAPLPVKSGLLPQSTSSPLTKVSSTPSSQPKLILPLPSKPVSPPKPSSPAQPTDPPKSSPPPTPPSTPTPNMQTTLSLATDVHKKKLPYNLNDLHWDMQHRSNSENKYCYCGGPGKWFLKMLQCGRCRQWFHGRCLSSLRYPLFYGDRFYVFLCTHCNSGKEFLRRLEIKWVDLVHLATFNLTLKTAKKYQDVDEEILNFINNSWNDLQLPPKILETNDSEKREIVLSVLTSNRNRFKCAREVKSRKTKWGLRVRVPPPTPVFSLPPNKPLSDQVLSDAWNNSARLKFLPPPPRNALPSKPEDDFDLSNLQDKLPGVDILHIETRLLVLPKGVPASGHNVCIKSSTPMYPESRAIKRRIKEQGMETDRLRRSRKARRLLRSSLNKDEGKERQDLPPTPPSSESNPEVATAQPDTSGDETSSRGTLDSIIPPPADFEGRNNPFLPLAPVLRPIKRRLSEKDIRVTSTGEVKRRKVRRSMKLSGRGVEGNGRGKLKRLKSSTPTSSPVKNQPSLSLEELKSSVNQYFGAVNRIASGEKFSVRAKRISLEGRTQYLINWGTPT